MRRHFGLTAAAVAALDDEAWAELVALAEDAEDTVAERLAVKIVNAFAAALKKG